MLPTQAFDLETSSRTLSLALGAVGDMAIMPALAEYLRQIKGNVRALSLAQTAKEAETELTDGKLDLYLGLIHSTSSDICGKALS